jgi:hypothetical protein
MSRATDGIHVSPPLGAPAAMNLARALATNLRAVSTLRRRPGEGGCPTQSELATHIVWHEVANQNLPTYFRRRSKSNDIWPS